MTIEVKRISCAIALSLLVIVAHTYATTSPPKTPASPQRKLVPPPQATFNLSEIASQKQLIAPNEEEYLVRTACLQNADSTNMSAIVGGMQRTLDDTLKKGWELAGVVPIRDFQGTTGMNINCDLYIFKGHAVR
jgi:hypothetical protein